MKKIVLGLLAGCLLCVSGVSAAAGAPVTVDLRIEGPTHTVFEGPVTTDVRKFKFTNSATSYDCDGTASTGGPSPTPAPVRNGALITAAETAGFQLLGSFGQFGASFTQVGDENVDYDPGTGSFLIEFLNGKPSDLGGCSEVIHTGDKLLYAYAPFGTAALALSGPATTTPGGSVVYTVTDLGTGTPIAGATVNGAMSDAAGHVTVGPLTAGPHPFKATKTDAIRSNVLSTCATTGSDGFCGTTKPGDPPVVATPAAPCLLTNGHDGRCGTKDITPPFPISTFVKDKQTFASGQGPRTLSGVVPADPSGIKDIRLALSRNSNGKCSRYDGASTRFVKLSKCGAKYATQFSAGTATNWSYLLPSALPKGRYVLDVQVTDGAGNVSPLTKRGRDRFVFYVS